MAEKLLSAAAVEKAKPASRPYRKPDGGSLYLQVSPGGAKSWTFRYRVGARVREMGLGVYPSVGLAEARRLRDKAREAHQAGTDPIASRRPSSGISGVTFMAAAEHYINKKSAGWSLRQIDAWRSSMGKLDFKDRLVASIGTREIIEGLKVWEAGSKTARDVLRRVRHVLADAAFDGHRATDAEPGDTWFQAYLDNAPTRPRAENLASIPWQVMPAFMVRLRKRDDTAARALEFVILTCARTGEVLGDYSGKAPIPWSEVDCDKRLWRVEPDRMKARRPHTVPLSTAAIELLESLPGERQGPVFAGLHSKSLIYLLGEMDVNATVHGFRSSFVVWCEENEIPPEIFKAALAHEKMTGDQATAAYARSQLVEPRRPIMERWASFLNGQVEGENVVSLKRA